MGISYRKRLKIAVDPELIYVPEEKKKLPLPRKLDFFTKEGLHVATAYRRVVIGGRGPYVEFHYTDIVWAGFYVPEEMEYRADDKRAFYEEWRSICPAYVKLYLQKRKVAYADYKVHMCYISPFDLYLDDKTPIII
jgi:hypothetical protein